MKTIDVPSELVEKCRLALQKSLDAFAEIESENPEFSAVTGLLGSVVGHCAEHFGIEATQKMVSATFDIARIVLKNPGAD